MDRNNATSSSPLFNSVQRVEVFFFWLMVLPVMFFYILKFCLKVCFVYFHTPNIILSVKFDSIIYSFLFDPKNSDIHKFSK